MKLLEKESIDFYLERAWTLLRYVFFKDEEYDGLNSHQEAVLEFLNYSSRLCAGWSWRIKEGLIVSKKIYAQKLYEFREEKIIYTDIRFFDKMKKYPIYVNKEMMKAKRITPESFWADDGIYRTSFLEATQGAEGTEEEFNQLNDRLFPDKDHLYIYLWNNEFTNYYNEGRYWDGAYVWSVYDEKRKRFTVFDARLVMI
ncbi:TPA: hypothetical protein IXR70_000403 [Enterococcus faecium]|uniref:hypothetical protein n=1 Tax=Enterococcus lactis TaxID=357441 RepID=UPI00280CF83C|nr:hypothetical protein [Enterococcus faecium]NTL54296.1 hypothetical protein [Enterococcus faecium]NTL59713.1 hypothetical protein [Enterococcus faecium]HAQ4445284.1 hypothetical protein [Enterococcus faecium]HAQ4456536.1 hypothetical protein [Enterococcus faecium]